MRVYLNGRIIDKTEAKISVEDRGFIFGDGVYEVWRVINGRLFETDRHHARLEKGFRELQLTYPADLKRDALQDVAERLLKENDLLEGEATFYLEVTRGAAPRAHHFPKDAKPTVYAFVNRITPSNEQKSGGSAITMPDIRWHRCDIKTVQLLPNVLAKQAAVEAGGVEAILLRDGWVTEASHSNVFVVLDGELRTHAATNLILPGITRAVVLDLAHDRGVPVRQQAVRGDDLAKADEVFITGTTTDITPIIRIDGKAVAKGKPGPITVKLQAALRAHMEAFASAQPA